MNSSVKWFFGLIQPIYPSIEEKGRIYNFLHVRPSVTEMCSVFLAVMHILHIGREQILFKDYQELQYVN
jgi:hypothetical protein